MHVSKLNLKLNLRICKSHLKRKIIAYSFWMIWILPYNSVDSLRILYYTYVCKMIIKTFVELSKHCTKIANRLSDIS